ncbi:hypothetical protein FRC04_007928, partial [Tulasnella sp. 424]
MDIPSSTSQPSKTHNSGAALSAQVSGSAPQTGFLKKRLEGEVAVPSAKHSRAIARADIDRIENANRGDKSSDRKRGGVTIARRAPPLLDTNDSVVSSNAPTVVTASCSSILRPPPTPRFSHRLMRTNKNPTIRVLLCLL